MKDIASQKLPKTFTVKSPGSKGLHLYFCCNLDKPIRLRDENGENVGDFQTFGKMVVGPGCTHPNGGLYEIVDHSPICTITRAQLVHTFKDYIVPEREFERIEKAAKSERHEHQFDIDIRDIISLNGFRNQGDEYYGSHPVHGSKTGRNFWINVPQNLWYCFRHNTGGGPLQLLAVLTGIIDCEEAQAGMLRGNKFLKTLQRAKELGFIESLQHYSEHEFKPEDFFLKKKDGTLGSFIPKRLADVILKKYKFAAISDRSDIWFYDTTKGIWTDNGKEKIQEISTKYLDDYFKPGYTYSTERYIRYTNYIPSDRLGAPINKIIMMNGSYDLETGEISKYDSELYAINRIPVNYDPDADCPNIKKFLYEIASPQDIPKLVEFAGYCLYKKFPIARIVILEGKGSNGKTVYLNLLIKFLGHENVSSVSLQKLAEGGFRSSELYGKLANICGDIPARKLKDTGYLKKLTGQDAMTGEKKFRDPFQYFNYAKPIFSANEIPESWDDTIAFHRRVIIIPFPNFFTEEKGNVDINLLEKITTQNELSGFFNYVIKALKRFLKQGGFTNEKTIEERRIEYIWKSNPIHYFALTFVKKDSNWITKAQLYDHYVEICSKMGKTPKANNWFSREVRRYLPYVYEGKETIDGIKTKVWRGIRVDISKIENFSKNSGTVGTAGTAFSQLYLEKQPEHNIRKEKNTVPTDSTVPKKGQIKRFRTVNHFLDTTKPLFRCKKILPAEKCQQCNKLAVEYQIQTPNGNDVKQCKTCFFKMRQTFTKAEFIMEE